MHHGSLGFTTLVGGMQGAAPSHKSCWMSSTRVFGRTMSAAWQTCRASSRVGVSTSLRENDCGVKALIFNCGTSGRDFKSSYFEQQNEIRFRGEEGEGDKETSLKQGVFGAGLKGARGPCHQALKTVRRRTAACVAVYLRALQQLCRKHWGALGFYPRVFPKHCQG